MIGSTLDAANGRRSRCRILDEDPDLGAGLTRQDLAAATRALVAPVIEASGPHWQPPTFDPATSYGLLILDGLLGRRLRTGSAVATELLSCGDILRPWEEPLLLGSEFSLEWRVFHPTRLAVLDSRVTTLIGRRPQLVVNFSSRLLRRARSIAYLMAVSHQTRVENRLLETLAFLANTWGRVTPRGVRIPFRITHEVLSEILGAQRPSVTTAFRKLTTQGLVIRDGDGTLIVRDSAAMRGPAAPYASGSRASTDRAAAAGGRASVRAGDGAVRT
jgi:CRP/FNR family cyclic AMP-dependent transcriptional regulator